MSNFNSKHTWSYKLLEVIIRTTVQNLEYENMHYFSTFVMALIIALQNFRNDRHM